MRPGGRALPVVPVSTVLACALGCAVALGAPSASAAWSVSAPPVTAAPRNSQIAVPTATAVQSLSLDLGCLLGLGVGYTVGWTYAGPATGVTFTVSRGLDGVSSPLGGTLGPAARTVNDVVALVLVGTSLTYTVTARLGSWSASRTVTVC